ncbi:cytochrome c oxidase, cbb3-type, CcoQ subunit [Helicobacter anseris]|uniref:Cytochrome c oxidase, cbb3-type, CcoQ subunit n=1 Tax=Helicobacter anseris TaxID=375926 RepID=A0A3D8JAV4_9HELI|nr:cytochrome c oxidase, cbb3-type, CcoQ subunit [Helicobacter anseris]RDU74568.1 cytochrome c oxidase, cbb3-type, CcoQ subunit [Helicobacter anseris]
MVELEFVQGIAYFVITILLVVFLYSYIFSMYKRQRSGEQDYERYANLALKDNLTDEPIEKRMK